MICIPIMGKTEPDAIKAIERSARHCDLIELRMDLIPDSSVKTLIETSRGIKSGLKVLVTNRPNGGSIQKGKEANKTAFPEAETRRIAVLEEGVHAGCDYVDCELETAADLREELLSMIGYHRKRTRLIISHHQYEYTPSMAVLKRYLKACAAADADIIKIVTYAQCPRDNLRVMQLVDDARREGRDIAAFCMGEYGAISRIMAPLLGSCITYASLRRGLESAPGQLTVREIKDIFKLLSAPQEESKWRR